MPRWLVLETGWLKNSLIESIAQRRQPWEIKDRVPRFRGNDDVISDYLNFPAGIAGIQLSGMMIVLQMYVDWIQESQLYFKGDAGVLYGKWFLQA